MDILNALYYDCHNNYWYTMKSLLTEAECDFLVVASRSPGEQRYAMRSYGRTTDIIISRDTTCNYGSIHLGRVISSFPGGSAVLVDIGSTRLGFLPRMYNTFGRLTISWPPPEGKVILVQVVQEERTDKGAKLSQHITLTGSLIVFSPFQVGIAVSHNLNSYAERDKLLLVVKSFLFENEGVTIRQQAAKAKPCSIKSEIVLLRKRWQDLCSLAKSSSPPIQLDSGIDPLAELFDRAVEDIRKEGLLCSILVLCDSLELLTSARSLAKNLSVPVTVRLEANAAPGTLFQIYGFEDDIESALDREVFLSGGGRLYIDSTSALTAIDVDTAIAGLDELDAVNHVAVTTIAWQMRLRNLSGCLVVDFIAKRERLRRITANLRKAVAYDPLPVQISGPSPLGLVEMIRERHRSPLAGLMRQVSLCCKSDSITIGLAALRLVLRETTVQRHAYLGLEVANIVADALIGPLAMAVVEAEKHLGCRLEIRTSTTCQPDNIVVFYPAGMKVTMRV